MIIKFTNQNLEELAKRKELTGKQAYSPEVILSFQKRIFQMKSAKNTQDLRLIKPLHFEKLKEKRYKGKYSVRLSGAFRLIFGIDKLGGVEIIEIDEISDHYS
ncbi:type II toxin-antitoxin system RelE/ParE family toxin [Mucilaginibacter sp. SMC90]|uniref:type II toxin-antitoxin system RelE/ParE family toxin n=1 Tax=Mucilaginibacter sp. SMC90 TaxID=2929803 RepID=UPI001FB2F0EF|nr:type II toxin-antitoxin system RelE/ParE family toxin [Mucilaginibacter sp. SMC90]UOE47902.1 type II toxin-antitoxin system RelE/ParE family toxin [Mucilaginibacter sp. SMC90]